MSQTNEPAVETGPDSTGTGFTIKDKLTVISALSAVAAALLSGFVTLWVTTIQADIEELVASRQDTVARAELFRSLINDLSTEDKAGYALLTLWKIYQHEEDREIVVLAALERPNNNAMLTLTRLGFDKELEKYADTIKSLANLEDGVSSEAASNLILQTFSPLQVTHFLIDRINRNKGLNPFDDSVIRLIELTRSDQDAMELVKSSAGSNSSINPIFAYILYRSGQPETLRRYIQNIGSQPERHKEYIFFINKLLENNFADEDWESINRQLVSILETNDASLETYSVAEGFKLLVRDRLQNHIENMTLRDSIVQLSRAHLLKPEVSEVERFRALETLKSWVPGEALMTIAQIRACGDEFNLMLSTGIEDLLDLQVVEEKNPPARTASSEEWKRWLETNGRDTSEICDA